MRLVNASSGLFTIQRNFEPKSFEMIYVPLNLELSQSLVTNLQRGFFEHNFTLYYP